MIDIENIKSTSMSQIAGVLEDDTYRKKQSPQYLEQHIKPLWALEQKAIIDAVELCDGNIPKAAVYLEIAPSTIYRKMKEWTKKDLQS